MPNAIDLTTLPLVRAWLGITAPAPQWQAAFSYQLGQSIEDPAGHIQQVQTAGTSGGSAPSFNDAGGLTPDGTGSLVWQDMGPSEDSVIGSVITAASEYFLWRTGRGNADGTVPSSSPFVAPVAYNEWYDGSGNPRLFLRNSPIVSVQALNANGLTIPASTSISSPGYVIDGNAKALVLRGSFGTPSGGQKLTATFWNVGWLGRYGFPLGVQNVNAQYTAGFSGTPPDIQQAITQMVAVNYKRRQWIDQKMQAMAQGAGTVQYRDWELPPEVVSVINNYRRASFS